KSKEIARRLLEEGWGKKQYAAFGELCNKEKYVSHDPLFGDANLDGVIEQSKTYHAAFGDMTMNVLECFGEGDLVCTYWRSEGHQTGTFMGVPASGRSATVEGISVARIENDKIVEDWTQFNALGLLQQIGIIPKLEPEEPKAKAEEPRANP